MSELPSITVTKKPVTPQHPTNIHPTRAMPPAVPRERLSRRDQHPHRNRRPVYSRRRASDSVVMVEIAVSPHSERRYDRLVISPSNAKDYNAASVAQSLMSAADDLAALSVHGEKVTPHHSPRVSPAHSPSRYPQYQPVYIMNGSHNGGHPSNSQYRASPYPQHHSVSPGHSPSRHISPAGSIYNGSPSHSPSRPFITPIRRGSDLSNYSGDDVSLHNYFVQTPAHHPSSMYPQQQLNYNSIAYTPLGVSMPLHPRQPGSHKGSVSSRDASPSGVVLIDPRPSPVVSKQPAQAKDMSTQTSNYQHTLKPKHAGSRHHKHKRGKKGHSQHKLTTKQEVPTLDREKSFISPHPPNPNVQQTGCEQPRKKAVLIMKTVTTVTPTSDSGHQDVATETASFSRESTIHIDIDYDSTATADDILKSVILSELPNTKITTSILMPTPHSKKDSTSQQPSPSPSTERRGSVIPEISLICASPDDLTPASPGIPVIDGQLETGTGTDT